MGTYGAWEPSGSRCDPLPFIIQGDCVPHPFGAPPAWGAVIENILLPFLGEGVIGIFHKGGQLRWPRARQSRALRNKLKRYLLEI